MTPVEKVRERELGLAARRVMVRGPAGGGAAAAAEEDAREKKVERATTAAWRRKSTRSIQRGAAGSLVYYSFRFFSSVGVSKKCVAAVSEE